MAKCLVLGANGFIGSHLVDALVTAGHDVRAFDRFSKDPLFDKSNDIEIFRGDFLNKSDLSDALNDIEYVFHFISTTTPATAENDPLIDIETNIRMSIVLFELCASLNVKRVIFASTGGAIYGEGGDAPCSENDKPEPVSPYAIGKLTIEHYLHYFRVKRGLDSVCFRISNPYGERQSLHRKQGVIPIFLENIIKDKPLTVMGDGSMVRDYIYVKDVASMISQMFANETKSNTYNLGSGKGVDISELVHTVQIVSGKTAKIGHMPTPATFVHKVLLDVTRFAKEFKLAPKVGLEDGMRHTYNYIEKEVAKSNG